MNDSISYNSNKCNEDVVINNLVKLNDSISFKKYLLKNNQKRYYDDWIYFSSKDKTQYIALQTNYGGGNDEYKKIEISYIKGDYNNFTPLRVKEYFNINEDKTSKFSFITSDMNDFTTESKIKLGISENDFKKLIENRNFTTYFNSETLFYKYFNNKCLYEATYEFKNNKLIKFEFGYTTP